MHNVCRIAHDFSPCLWDVFLSNVSRYERGGGGEGRIDSRILRNLHSCAWCAFAWARHQVVTCGITDALYSVRAQYASAQTKRETEFVIKSDILYSFVMHDKYALHAAILLNILLLFKRTRSHGSPCGAKRLDVGSLESYAEIIE